jgi:isopenicillin-N N-acyltransferase-like protein
MALPLVRLEGTPYEQGLAHGEALRGRIAHNLGIYFERFAREVSLPRDEVLRRAARYAAMIAGRSPAYHAGMRGVAAGSGFSLEEIAALNVRYELFYDGYVEKPLGDGCTAFAVLPDASADGHLLIGENWDWIVGVQGAVLHTREPGGLETLAFSEAGIVGGKIGLNSQGLGLAINGLTSADDDWARLRTPFHVRCYEILRAPSFEAAVAVVTGEERSCSTNYLIARDPAQVVNIEAAPSQIGLSGCEHGCLVHANHFVEPAASGVRERNVETNPHSQHRHARLAALLRTGAALTRADLRAGLRDHAGHPYSVCFHIDPAEPPSEHYATLTSAIIDLTDRSIELTDGPPCEAEYVRYALS